MSGGAVATRPASARAALVLNFAAGALAVHGVLLALAGAMKTAFPAAYEAAGDVVMWVLLVPALVLTRPFTPLLWKLGLMNAPGWLAWPRPLGVALAYASWIAALLVLAWLARRAGHDPATGG